MSSTPPSHIKIYDRPERKGLPPMAMVLFVAILLSLAFFGYRYYTNNLRSNESGVTNIATPVASPMPPASTTQSGTAP